MEELEFDSDDTSSNMQAGPPRPWATTLPTVTYGSAMQDGSNEENNSRQHRLYAGKLRHRLQQSRAIPGIVDLNRWQSVALPIAIDQAGNLLEDGEPPFLGAEWGRVEPFALTKPI